MHDKIEEELNSIEQQYSDVTNEYEDEVEIVKSLAEAKTLPIPIDHIVVYRGNELDCDLMMVMSVVDDHLYGFDVPISSNDDGEKEMFGDKITRLLRTMKEKMWKYQVLEDG